MNTLYHACHANCGTYQAMDYRISEEHTWHDRRYDFFKQKVGWCSHALSDSIHHENKVIRHRPHCTKYYNKCIDLDDAIKVYGLLLRFRS